MQRKILPLSCIDSSAPVHCVYVNAPVCVCVEMWLFILLRMCVCMCVPSASISHFVPIISRGMGPNTAIHTSVRATETTASENGRLLWECRRRWEEEEEEAEDAEPRNEHDNIQ